MLLNLGVLAYHLDRGDWLIADGSALSALAALTLVNFAATVLIRQQTVLNVLFGLAGRGSRSWPLWLRWSVSKVHHVGGIHVGGALAGTAWLCAFACVATVAARTTPRACRTTTLVLASGLVALALLVVVCAAPPVRSRAHNVFELSHRLGGWTAIALFWALTVHLALRGRGDAAALEAIASDWHVWVLAILTASVASPWLRLRRVPVTVERPSSHAAIVRFDYGVTPAFASAVGISRSPLREWHAFATVTTPGESGYRLLDLPRRRLDRAVHRRPAVPRLGPRHAGLGADGQGRAPLRAGRLRRHRQRDRPLSSGRSWPRASRRGSSGPRATRAPPTATASSTRSSARSPTP